ncbi:MAG: transcriptional repressor LexA [Anaerolineales bacterium]|jgi:repressor LexA
MTPRRRSSTLTDPQKKVLKVIEEYQNTNGFPPSIRDIQDMGSFSSTSVVNYYLEQLETMGHIKRSGRVSRGIRLIRPFSELTQTAAKTAQNVRESLQQVLRIPVMGRIFASEPVPVPSSDFAYLDAESVVSVARDMLPAREKVDELFALEVNGDSMIDAMVNDGDIVIMKPAKDVHNGDLVAIWLHDKDETTLKYFFLEDGKVRLQPANPTMKPIYIDDPTTVDIQGKIVMIIRPCEMSLL